MSLKRKRAKDDLAVISASDWWNAVPHLESSEFGPLIHHLNSHGFKTIQLHAGDYWLGDSLRSFENKVVSKHCHCGQSCGQHAPRVLTTVETRQREFASGWIDKTYLSSVTRLFRQWGASIFVSDFTSPPSTSLPHHGLYLQQTITSHYRCRSEPWCECCHLVECAFEHARVEPDVWKQVVQRCAMVTIVDNTWSRRGLIHGLAQHLTLLHTLRVCDSWSNSLSEIVSEYVLESDSFVECPTWSSPTSVDDAFSVPVAQRQPPPTINRSFAACRINSRVSCARSSADQTEHLTIASKELQTLVPLDADRLNDVPLDLVNVRQMVHQFTNVAYERIWDSKLGHLIWSVMVRSLQHYSNHSTYLNLKPYTNDTTISTRSYAAVTDDRAVAGFNTVQYLVEYWLTPDLAQVRFPTGHHLVFHPHCVIPLNDVYCQVCDEPLDRNPSWQVESASDLCQMGFLVDGTCRRRLHHISSVLLALYRLLYINSTQATATIRQFYANSIHFHLVGLLSIIMDVPSKR